MIGRLIRCGLVVVVPVACLLAAAAGLAPRPAAADDAPAPTSPAAPSAPAAPATAPAVPHEVALLIAQLGDDDPKVREAAGKRLSAMGKSVLPALRTAAAGDDPEVAMQAQRLISAFRYGIGPDTPPEVMELVKQYRTADANQKQRAVQQLRTMGWVGYRVLAKLRREETDPGWREMLASALRTGAQAVVNRARELITAGSDDEAEAILADGASGGEGEVSRSYAALLLARGRLDAARRELETETGDKPGPDDALLLARLARAGGDGDAVLRYAGRVGPQPGYPWGAADDLKREVWLDRHDWAKLVEAADRRLEEEQEAENGNGGNGNGGAQVRIVVPGPAPAAPNRLPNRNFGNPSARRSTLADKASCARLGGEARAFNDAVAALRHDAEESPDSAFSYAIPLLLNGKAAEGMEVLLAGKQYLAAFPLMIAQGRQDEALRLTDAAKADQWQNLPLLELTAAQTLVSLGEQNRASEIVQRVAKEVEAGNGGNPGKGGNGPNVGPVANGGNGPDAQAVQAELIRAGLALGPNFHPFDRLAAVLQTPAYRNNPAAAMAIVLPASAEPALRWRNYLSQQHPGTSDAEVLAKVWALFARKLPPGEVDSLLHEALEHASTLQAATLRDSWLAAVADAARAAGRDDLAGAAFEKFAASSDGWFPWKFLGDRAAKKRDWAKAVECYANAKQKDPKEPTCLWLHAWARRQAGDGDAAAIGAEMNRADELLLADDTRWAAFVQAIAEAGADATEDAERQRELLRRLLDPAAWAYNESWHQSAHALLTAGRRWFEVEDPLEDQAGEEAAGPHQLRRFDPDRYLRAADMMDRWLIPMAVGRMEFRMPAAYLSQPVVAHMTRARGLIERDGPGDLAAAMKEADAALALMPANSQLPIDLVPALDRHGHKAEADALFRKVATAAETSLARYPNCAELHNGLAWMGAKCDRDLDKALENAEQATKLSPEQVGYLDTLAEVHFHRGERQAAIDTMKKCIEMDPHFEYLQRQLKRFTAAGGGAAGASGRGGPTTAPGR